MATGMKKSKKSVDSKTPKKEEPPKAGVLPYFIDSDGEITMMFMCPSHRKDTGKNWQLAKGHFKKNESPEDCAFREANEELGLFKPNCTNIQDMGNYGNLHMFIAEVKDKRLFGDPTMDDSDSVIWLTLSDFMLHGRFGQQHIVSNLYKTIQRKCQL